MAIDLSRDFSSSKLRADFSLWSQLIWAILLPTCIQTEDMCLQCFSGVWHNVNWSVGEKLISFLQLNQWKI